ncbi:hypothetical protein F5B20DRAFT_581848 [Whalleya microplaca]|nr:hypothetical protein F5B20DRAFT_581848 [Whalleya microplaca]
MFGSIPRSEIINLCSAGDGVLAVYDKKQDITRRFLVSSKALGAASSALYGFLNPVSKEDPVKPLQAKRPERLVKEDADAMSIILHIIHLRNGHVSANIEPKQLATIAILSKKYNCNRALRLWITKWCSQYRECASSEEVGYQLLAAFLFERENFPDLVARAAMLVEPRLVVDWPEHDLLGLLPKVLLDNLVFKIDGALADIKQALEDAEGRLRACRTTSTCFFLRCSSCGRSSLDRGRSCGSCVGLESMPTFCDAEGRVSEFFRALAGNGVWPSFVAFNHVTVWQLLSKFEAAKDRNLHLCEMRERCPLKVELARLFEQACNVQEYTKRDLVKHWKHRNDLW